MTAIFIVEDNAPLAQLYTKFLVYTGATITHATSCREAFAQLEEGYTPDVILLDISLPDGDGLSIAKYLRANAKFQRTQIIMVSGDEAYYREAQALGIENFFCKPVSVPRLAECVKQLLAQSKTAASAQPNRGQTTVIQSAWDRTNDAPFNLNLNALAHS